MTGLDDLESWFREAGRVLLGYSGGIDSSLLGVVGTRVLGPGLLAVIGRSAAYPAVQWETARAIADGHGIAVLEVDTSELDDPGYRANPTNRCYFCKRELWHVLGAIARERGFGTVIDGTHAEDLTEHRPGMRAGADAGVRSPLAELGWTKARIREAARSLGIRGWDGPSSPCLASRIRYGVEVTPTRLGQVEQAEAMLRALGVEGDLRVRHLGGVARIEAAPAMIPLIRAHWDRVEAALEALGFERGECDPAGYRRGSLLAR